MKPSLTSTSEFSPASSSALTMTAVVVEEFVEDFDELSSCISVAKDAKVPLPGKNELLIKVEACSISPGDVVMIQGNMIIMHPSTFPFVPGMDVCGVVVDANGSTNFKNGDIVVAANGILPVGGMAEYMAVSEEEAVLKPSSVSTIEAAACSSAITARNAVMDYMRKGDRVLILGGSGGVGTAAIQIAKSHGGASFVATTSTQTDLCIALGADKVINYNEENWWEMAWAEQFDIIIDTVGGGNFTEKAVNVLKTGAKGGRFIAVAGDNTKPDCTTWWKTIKFFASLSGRPLYTRLFSRTVPRYSLLLPYNISKGREQVLSWMQEGSLKVKLDGGSPLPFTKAGVQKAFQTVAGGHAHGKVVISMLA